MATHTLPRALRLVALLLACSPAALVSQEGPIPLQPGHWTYDAIRRMNVLGVAPPASDPSVAAVTREHAATVFTESAENAEAAGRGDVAELARGYLRRLTVTEGAPGETRIRLGAGAIDVAGELLAAEWMKSDGAMRPARELERLRGPLATAAAQGALGSRAAWTLQAAWLGEEPALPVAAVGARVGPFDVWGGRQRVHHGAGRGGGVVSGVGWTEEPLVRERSTHAVNGGGIGLRSPFYFPGFLRFLGASRVEIVGGRTESVGDAEGAYVVFGRLTGQPFSPRFTLGLNRGALFGGTGRAVTLRRLVGMTFGLYQEDDDGVRSGFENQVLSGIARYRPPTERWLPLEFYLEWGADDMAGAVRDNPGIVAGLDMAAVPGVGGLSLTVEHARFVRGSTGPVRPWYVNFAYGGSWSDAGRALAHPLGGSGWEWQLGGTYDRPALGFRATASAFTRGRHDLGMYFPDRDGRSRGGSAGARVLLRDQWLVSGFGSLESGDGWREARVIVRTERIF
jgi:hypothetical protein